MRYLLYLFSESDYEVFEILGVFDTKEQAQKQKDNFKDLLNYEFKLAIKEVVKNKISDNIKNYMY